jgi:hypothetical protein
MKLADRRCDAGFCRDIRHPRRSGGGAPCRLYAATDAA